MRRALLAATLVLALVAAPAAAAPAVDGVFNMPGVSINGQLTVGSDGNIWVALEAAVGRVTPDGTVTVFESAQLGTALGAPEGGITSAGGFIWVGQAPNGGKKAIVRIPPGNPAGAQGVDVTGIDAGAKALSLGPDGDVWAAQNGKIVHFSPSTLTAAPALVIGGLSPRGMAWASDGTLWVTDVGNGGQLLNIATGGTATPYSTTGGPQGVAAGPNGQVAFANPNSAPQQIGRLVPGGTPQLLDRPNGSDPFGVTFGNDGAYWIAEFAGNRLSRVTTDGQLTPLTGFPVVSGQGPRQITTGPNNTLWTTLNNPGDPANSKIARITGVEPPPPPPDTTPPGDQTPVTTPPPPPPDTTAPAITLVSLSKARTIRFTLSEAAAVKLTLSRAAAGKRRGKACVRPTPRLRRAKRCTRFVRIRTISANGVAGQNSIRFAAKKLRAGRYRIVLTASDAAGNAATPVTRTFRVRR